MIVEVVVDIPAHQVNQTYDYSVPQAWERLIQPGIRVQVPFGRLKRTGFVVKIQDQSEFEGKLRPISEVMDYQSYLSQELIELSDYLARHLNCFRISVLQAMLPAMLKVKYQETFDVLDTEAFGQELARAQAHEASETKEPQVAQEPQADREAQESHEIQSQYRRQELESLLSQDAIQRLLSRKVLRSYLDTVDRGQVKTETYYQPVLERTAYLALLNEIPERSHKQRDFILYLTEHWDEGEVSRRQAMEDLDLAYSTLRSIEDKGWVKRVERPVYTDPLRNIDIEESPARTLLPEQAQAFNTILPAIREDRSQTYLIEGVTGSGKTEIYLQLMEEVMKAGKSSILLVPEISLTPQMVSRVVGRFDEGVAVLHSGLSLRERFDEWRRIIEGEATIVVGARSSIFAPLKNLGLIIIDEEHETTYKQSDNPRYHARDVAKWRSEYNNCPLVLGSATPSLESRARAQVGNYQLIELKARVNQRPLPPVELIDMTQPEYQSQYYEFSQPLIDKIRERLEAKEQVVILLNRRGYASYLLCRECGFIPRCPRCDISLTYHKADQRMKCHYCDYHEGVPHACPQCNSQHIRTHGVGTQKIAEVLGQIFPQAKVTRMDNDTTRQKGQYYQLLKEFEEKRTDILLGTQMIAKGLDFENVTLVGVINADTSLNLPDFRSGEKTFQLMTQVSGRAGRGDKPGEVLIQTYNPDHYVMNYIKHHNYTGFFYHEMKRRHVTQYPPYFFTTLITVSSKQQGKALEEIYKIKSYLSQLPQATQGQLIMIGPSRSQLAKINEYYYFNILLKYKDKDLIGASFMEILNQSQEQAKYRIYINIDHEPQYFF